MFWTDKVVVFSRTLKDGKEEKEEERRIDCGLLRTSDSVLLNHEFSFIFILSS